MDKSAIRVLARAFLVPGHLAKRSKYSDFRFHGTELHLFELGEWLEEEHIEAAHTLVFGYATVES